MCLVLAGWSWRYWRGQAAAYWDFLMVCRHITFRYWIS
jgi:hypothetical protein